MALHPLVIMLLRKSSGSEKYDEDEVSRPVHLSLFFTIMISQ